MSKNVAIGIDLGTTCSCVGFLQNDRVEIVANEIGLRTTPSCVAFDDTEVHIGQAAKDQADVNPRNTIFEAKRLIGRKFSDSSVQKDISLWPFEVIDDGGGAPKFRIQFRMKEKIIPPEQISGLILSKLKRVAETYIGSVVKDAVITVPAYFTDSQRQATIDAGTIAGLNVVKIINEPTAAALAFGYSKKVAGVRKILVFDLGGGTFDVAVLAISGNTYEVKAVGGDSHLGGGDFDSQLLKHFIRVIHEKYNKSLAGNPQFLQRLRKACEAAKIRLSSSAKAKVDIAALFDGKDFRESITRTKFESLCCDLFNETISHVHSVLEDSRLKIADIDEVLLVGGSSRIPKIQELLTDYFCGKKLNTTVNPDEAVTHGAVLHAAMASEELKVVDVIPQSLGLRNNVGEMVTFIKRNSQIPRRVVDDTWTTTDDNRTQCKVCVYAGERKMTLHNDFLGSFTLDIGEEERAGIPQLSFTFDVDANGILHVQGENLRNKCVSGQAITSNKGRLKEEEIERLVHDTRDLQLCD